MEPETRAQTMRDLELGGHAPKSGPGYIYMRLEDVTDATIGDLARIVQSGASQAQHHCWDLGPRDWTEIEHQEPGITQVVVEELGEQDAEIHVLCSTADMLALLEAVAYLRSEGPEALKHLLS